MELYQNGTQLRISSVNKNTEVRDFQSSQPHRCNLYSVIEPNLKPLRELHLDAVFLQGHRVADHVALGRAVVDVLTEPPTAGELVDLT